MKTIADLDKTDRKILRLLQTDGRISNLKLAEAVHLSPTAVLERVRRLTRDGYVLGYEARLNPKLLDAGLMVFVEVLLDRTVHDVMDTFKAAVQVRPEILEAHLVAGGFDYLLKTRVADMAAYDEVARLTRREIDLEQRFPMPFRDDVIASARSSSVACVCMQPLGRPVVPLL